jgi:hypothetical protein
MPNGAHRTSITGRTRSHHRPVHPNELCETWARSLPTNTEISCPDAYPLDDCWGFESFLQRILAEAELEFAKGQSSQKTANRQPRMRHIHDQTRESLKKVSLSIVNLDEFNWRLVMVTEQVVGERGAELKIIQLRICLIWRVALSKRSIVISIWTNSESFQTPSKPGSAASNPLEDLRLNSKLCAVHESTMTPFSNCPMPLIILIIEPPLWESNMKQYRMIEVGSCLDSISWWGLGPTW